MSVEKWMVAVGKSFGVREVHAYRWPDAETRHEIPHIVYTPMSLNPGGLLRNANLNTTDDHDVTTNTSQECEVKIRIDLHNDKNGLVHLAWVSNAAGKQQEIQNVLTAERLVFKGLDGDIESETRHDDERLYYHQWMVVRLRVWLNYAHLNRNFLVDQVDIGPVNLE